MLSSPRKRYRHVNLLVNNWPNDAVQSAQSLFQTNSPCSVHALDASSGCSPGAASVLMFGGFFVYLALLALRLAVLCVRHERKSALVEIQNLNRMCHDIAPLRAYMREVVKCRRRCLIDFLFFFLRKQVRSF